MKVSFLRFLPISFLAVAQLHAQIAVEDYESTGYTLSDSIGIYTGWSVGAGAATISDAESQEQPSGQSILFAAGSTISEATRTVQVGEAITTGVAWWDFWVLPVVHSGSTPIYTLDADGAQIEFRLDGSVGRVRVLDGGGLSSGQNVALDETFAVTGSEADAWMRLTLRQDYTNGIWDLYIDGQSVPAAANLGFDGTPTEPTSIKIYGDTASPVYLDLLQLASTSPIFTDADNDGMLDTWETDHGLDTAVNDRDSDLDRDDLTNIEEYVSGLNPSYFYDSGKPLFVHFTADSPEEYGDFNADAIVQEGANNVYHKIGPTALNTGEVLHSELIPIDTSRAYRVSARLKSLSSTNSRTYLGVRYYKADGSLIEGYEKTRQNTAFVISSVTDTEITATTSVSGWYSSPALNRYLGFYYDGDTAKLPDYVVVDASNGAYSSFSGTQINLTSPLPAEVVSNLGPNSVVMNHLSGNANSYLWKNFYPEAHWSRVVSQNISGESTTETTDFAYGAAYAQIVFLLNYNQSASQELYLDDIIFEEIVDLDADGIPDWWEREVVYDIDPLDAYASIDDVLAGTDVDGDGLDTLAEYQGGNNPFLSDNISHNYRRYVDNLLGHNGYTGRSPYPRVPAWNSGPNPTIAKAMSATANTLITVIIKDHGPGYDLSSISFANKDLVLRLDGDVTLRAE